MGKEYFDEVFVSNVKDSGLLEELKYECEKVFQSKPNIEKKIVICGGMAKCRGLVERFKMEPYFENFNVSADEDFIWKGAAKYVKSMLDSKCE